MNKGLVRILSLLLVVTMCVSTFGLTAFAALISDFSAPPLALEQTVDEDEGTVTVTVKANAAFTFMGASATIEYDKNAFSLTTNAITGAENLSLTKNLNADKGATVVVTTDENVEFTSGDTFLTFEFTENEGISDGTYSFVLDVTGWTNANYGSDTFTNSKTNTVNYTIGSTTPEVTEAYTAALSSTTTTVNNDGTSTVSVDVVVGGTTGSFASTEIKLSYDSDYLTYSSGSCVLTATVPEGKNDQEVSISAENGVVTIRDYGGTMNVAETGTTAYTLVFNTVKGGNTNVSLSSAGFSTQDNAASENLTYVTDTSSKVSVTIKHKVTISEKDSTGDPTVEYAAPNGDYTFTIPGYSAGYTYTVSAAIDGVSVSGENIVDNGNGSYTVKNVTGALAITFEKTAISYTVTFDDKTGETTTVVSNVTGAALANSVYTVPYNTAVGFTVAAGLAPNGTADGYYYSVRAYLTDNTNTAVTVSSTETDNYAAKTYTIAADAITGNITIEVTKTVVSATETTITVEGPYTEVVINSGALTSESFTATKNANITFTLNKEDGYIYTVKTKIGDAEATEVDANDDGSYTINAGDSGLILQIFKALDTTSLSVSQYVQLDGTVMWLVKINYNNNTQIEGKTYTYDNNNMFWSSKYQTYCYLIVAESDPYNNADDQAKAEFVGKLRLTEDTATAINYNGNVNLTTNTEGAAVIDVNDAQLVWNMYSAVYSDTNTVSVQKFLEADMTGNGSLGTDDAAAVVSAIG